MDVQLRQAYDNGEHLRSSKSWRAPWSPLDICEQGTDRLKLATLSALRVPVSTSIVTNPPVCNDNFQ